MEGWYIAAIFAVIPVAALVVDTVFGDPRSDWHPVVLIGRVIRRRGLLMEIHFSVAC